MSVYTPGLANAWSEISTNMTHFRPLGVLDSGSETQLHVGEIILTLKARGSTLVVRI